VTAELTELPIVVLNSHTHSDHVGGNWQFKDVLGMDTDAALIAAPVRQIALCAPAHTTGP
jgi:glyoxylase-like metal-dependent hydrolase (beta-lactamase superfamily II)